jgi:hypothetical protein
LSRELDFNTNSGLGRSLAANFTFPSFFLLSNANNSTMVTSRSKLSTDRYLEIRLEEFIGNVISGGRLPLVANFALLPIRTNGKPSVTSLPLEAENRYVLINVY